MKDITKYPKQVKRKYYTALLSGREPVIQQNIDTKGLKVKQGRKYFKTDIFSLEDFLKGHKKAVVFKKQDKKSSRERLIDIIDLHS